MVAVIPGTVVVEVLGGTIVCGRTVGSLHHPETLHGQVVFGRSSSSPRHQVYFTAEGWWYEQQLVKILVGFAWE